MRCPRTLPCVTQRSPVLSRLPARAIYVRKHIQLLKTASTFRCASRPKVSRAQARAKTTPNLLQTYSLAPWLLPLVRTPYEQVPARAPFPCTFAVPCACFHLTICHAPRFGCGEGTIGSYKSPLYWLKSAGVHKRGCSRLVTDRQFTSRCLELKRLSFKFSSSLNSGGALCDIAM